jgi:hypothetical protein
LAAAGRIVGGARVSSASTAALRVRRGANRVAADLKLVGVQDIGDRERCLYNAFAIDPGR